MSEIGRHIGRGVLALLPTAIFVALLLWDYRVAAAMAFHHFTTELMGKADKP